MTESHELTVIKVRGKKIIIMIFSLKMFLHSMLFNTKSRRICEMWQEKILWKHKRETTLYGGGQETRNKFRGKNLSSKREM